jgi:hypothetical protein
MKSEVLLDNKIHHFSQSADLSLSARVEFEVFRAMIVKGRVFWVLTACYSHRGIYRLHLQGQRIIQQKQTES